MSLQEEIIKAIGAHGMWKSRLMTAIDSSKSTFTVESVGKDDVCDFGKWLHGLSASDKSSPHYAAVLALHAEFHRATSAVLRLAIEGKKEAATAAMGPNSEYATATSKLTQAMMIWKQSAK
jgi:hypothetical protein